MAMILHIVMSDIEPLTGKFLHPSAKLLQLFQHPNTMSTLTCTLKAHKNQLIELTCSS